MNKLLETIHAAEKEYKDFREYLSQMKEGDSFEYVNHNGGKYHVTFDSRRNTVLADKAVDCLRVLDNIKSHVIQSEDKELFKEFERVNRIFYDLLFKEEGLIK